MEGLRCEEEAVGDVGEYRMGRKNSWGRWKVLDVEKEKGVEGKIKNVWRRVSAQG